MNPKSLDAERRYLALVRNLGEGHEANQTPEAIAARIAWRCRYITGRLAPTPGFVPTGFASEADHQKLNPLQTSEREERQSKRRASAEREHQRLYPGSTPLATREARRREKRIERPSERFYRELGQRMAALGKPKPK